MSTNFEKVMEFHVLFEVPVADSPQSSIALDRFVLRLDLIDEETNELRDGCMNQDPVAIADALGDLLYVTYGMGLEYGIDLDAVFDEIHRSNLAKLGADGKPLYREDGKVKKPEGWKEPDIKGVLGL